VRQLILFAVLLFMAPMLVHAGDELDYRLEMIQVADDTYAFIGEKEDFSRSNGGNIVNTGFIVTDTGVIVIDTGPSLLYGQQMREAIGRVTDKPIIKVLLTHHHPDHIFGSQAFADTPVYALPGTLESIRGEAQGFLDNLYRMVGPWMKGTRVMESVRVLEIQHENIGGHALEYITMSGHTAGDLMVFDEKTGVLFAGDLVFHNRALTTPHADPGDWMAALDRLLNMDFRILVPGHGELSSSKDAVEQTRDYLLWLESTIRDAVQRGLDMNEVMQIPLPERFQALAVISSEYPRSVIHRFPVYEEELLQ
jgi:uncharacterized sulfatase